MASRLARPALALTTALLAGLLATPAASTAAPTTAPGPAAASDGTLDVLVLGDSYSAGNGATDDAGVVQDYGPTGCRRSKVNWGEKYAAALRAGGLSVRLANHACSGGVSADLVAPRAMDTASRIIATPSGVTTRDQADASLRKSDPCNTMTFPDEEFWTYRTTSVTPAVTSYDCTRNLRPQTDFVTPQVDLVVFTMGGNDAGFSSIVQSCFVPALRTSASCKAKVDTARSVLPQVQQRLLTGIEAMRAHGLREDARLVQLGYPWLQLDNGYTLSDPPGYAAGAEVRALVSEGNAAIASIVPAANDGHPGQLTFVDGVPEKFSGHEPDASTPAGNPDRWVNQVGDGDAIDAWYHPNRFGQTAYAELLAARGTFGATNGPAVVAPTARLKVKVRPRPATAGDRVRAKVVVRLSDGSAPHGKVVVREVTRGHHRKLGKAMVRPKDRGRATVRFRTVHPGKTKVRVVYRDQEAKVVRVTKKVRVRR